jgi:hypothetical protein
MEIDELFAREHIEKWTKAWNDHNMKEILSFYYENILFRSPKVKLVYPGRSSATITNKTELKEFFSLALKKYPNIHFIPVEYFLKNKTIVFEYYCRPDNEIQWSVFEKFDLNAEGLISNSEVYYGAEEQ